MISELTKEEILDAIAKRVMKDFNFDDVEAIIERKTNEAVSKVSNKLTPDVLNKFIQEKLNKVWDNKCVQPTDRFGDPVGKPQTLEEILLESTKDFWSRMVDREGKPTNYNGMTMASYLIQKVGLEAFNKAFSSQLEGLVKEAVDQYRKDSQQYFQEILKKCLNKTEVPSA